MNAQRIEEGLVIVYAGAVLEYSNRTETSIWFQDVKTGDFVEFTEDNFRASHARQELLVLNAKSTATTLSYSESVATTGPTSEIDALLPALTETQQQTVERRLDYVKRIREMGIGRGQLFLLADAAKRISALRGETTKPPSTPTLNRWMQRYEVAHYEVQALIPKYVTRKTAHCIESRNEELIEQSIDEIIFQQGAMKDSAVIRHYDRLVKAENIKLLASKQPTLTPVSDSTIRRRIADKPQYDICEARLGRREARQIYRMAKGVLPADYALQYAEIDHTQLNWWVIDDALMLPLGLPWLTVIRDRFTKVVLGIYLTFRKTGLSSIFGAIRHSIYAHNKIGEIWPEIENNWISNGFATTYVSDRGADFLSPRYRLTMAQIGADIEYCERETPWHKGGVERFGGEHAELFECMPGRTFPFRHSPRGYNPKEHAVIRFSAACFLIHKWICDKYHVTPIHRKQASPQELWLESIAKVPPALPPTPEPLDVLMGELHIGSLSHEGVRHKWLSYANDQLEQLRKDIGLKQKVAFVPHVNEMGHIHVIDPRTNRPFLVECRQADYATGKTQFQHEYALRLSKGKLNGRSAEGIQQVLCETEQDISDDLANKLAKTENGAKLNLWQAARRAGINSNDVMEGKPQTILNLVHSAVTPQPSAEEEKPIPATQSFTEVPTFSWGC